MTAAPIIPDARHGYVPSFVPPHFRRGRHALVQQPHRLELINQQAARWFADRLRPAHLDVVRSRVAKWAAIAVPVALYLAIAAGAVLGAVGR